MQDQFSFDVGHAERHRVDFSYDSMWGKLKITVDGYLVETGRLFVDFSLTRRYQFNVGQTERHAIVIDKTRKLLFAGFRSSSYQIWIDGQPAYVVDGRGLRPAGVQPSSQA